MSYDPLLMVFTERKAQQRGYSQVFLTILVCSTFQNVNFYPKIDGCMPDKNHENFALSHNL